MIFLSNTVWGVRLRMPLRINSTRSLLYMKAASSTTFREWVSFVVWQHVLQQHLNTSCVEWHTTVWMSLWRWPTVGGDKHQWLHSGQFSERAQNKTTAGTNISTVVICMCEHLMWHSGLLSSHHAAAWQRCSEQTHWLGHLSVQAHCDCVS